MRWFWAGLWWLSEVTGVGLGRLAPYVFGRMLEITPHQIRSSSVKKGKFIVVEGEMIDEVLKHSIALSRWLTAENQATLWTAQPSSGAIGRDISRRIQQGDGSRDDVMIALLDAADRADHIRRVIRPTLDAGTNVVCAGYAYRSVVTLAAQAEHEDWLRGINDRFIDPDLVIFLVADTRTPVEVAYKREDRLRRELRRGGTATLDVGTGTARVVQRRCQQVAVEALDSEDGVASGLRPSGEIDIPVPTPQQAVVLRRVVSDPEGTTACSALMADELISRGLARSSGPGRVEITDLGRVMLHRAQR